MVGNDLQRPVADAMAAGLHPHAAVMGELGGGGIFARLAGEARRMHVADGDAGRMAAPWARRLRIEPDGTAITRRSPAGR